MRKDNLYKNTVVKQNPEYVDKNLLLIESSRQRLFRTEDGCIIEVQFNSEGRLSVFKVERRKRRILISYSLRKIGTEFLGFKDPSVNQMLKYLVLPEMEVERIFNNLRYKYLNSIHMSGFENPSEFISSKYNRAFQAFAGMNVYQGNVKVRKDNNYFWKEAGFKEIAKKKDDFSIERDELGFIIAYLKGLKPNNYNRIYAELIGIKPGFHEIWLHSDYFDKKSYPKSKTVRAEAFRLLRGVGKLENLRLDTMPHEINSKSYFSYASCNVTEGPFVFRKKISGSYFEDIRKVRSRENIKTLKKKFDILDYHNDVIDSKKKLTKILKEAERFRGFL